MPDALVLALVIAAFHLVHAAAWARADGWQFHAHTPAMPLRAARLEDHGLKLREQAGIAMIRLCPMGVGVAADPYPFTVEPGRILLQTPEALLAPQLVEAADWHAYADLLPARIESHYVHFANGACHACSSKAQARRIVAWIRELAQAESLDREALAVRQWTDYAAQPDLPQRYADLKDDTALLGALCTCTALYIYVGWPVVALAHLPITLLQLFAGYIAMVPIVLWHLRTAVRRSGVGLGLDWLFIAISPADLIHARQTLLARALAAHHPWAIAHAATHPATQSRFVRAYLLELAHAASLHPFPAMLLNAANRLLTSQSLDPASLLRAPNPEPGMQSWCPRCDRQYLQAQGNCPYCPDVQLQPVPAPAPPAAAARSPDPAD